jgi:hypothetical protein
MQVALLSTECKSSTAADLDAPAKIDDPILVEHADAIRTLGKQTIANIIEIGRHLTEAKKIAGHGNWLPWLEREFGWSDDTAERFIRLAALAHQIPQVAEYDIPISGLYLLAKPSTPEEARGEIMELAKSGEPVSTSTIKETIRKSREPTKGSEISVDGKPIIRLSRVQKLEQTNAALQEEINRLTRAGDDFFNKEDTATDIWGMFAYQLLRLSPSKRRSVLGGLPEMVARLEAERENGKSGASPGKH